MAQSSDFCITTPGSGATVNETSQKQVVLQYMRWSGLVCYTGVAKYNSHNTAEWLTDALTHDPGQRSPQQVVDQLVKDGTKWLRRVPATYRHHTFTMITYEKKMPNVYVISNFERPNGPQLPTPEDALFCTHLRPHGPRCVVTGYTPAVLDPQRMALRDLLASNPTPLVLRETVAMASREASARAKGSVSESCVVSHLCPDGSGEAQVFGNLAGEFLPTMITSGQNVATLMPMVKNHAGVSGPQRLVGATWTANGNEGVSVMTGAYRLLSEQAGDGWPSTPPVR
jgi:hypothetical protein